MMTNQDKAIIELTVRHLEEGHIILYPTDTVWGLGCDAFDAAAVDKIFAMKKRDKEKNLIVLVSTVDMLKRYVGAIPAEVASVVDEASSPTTVIYPEVREFPDHLCARDGSCAIRIIQHDLIRAVIESFGRPIISTSANISGHPVAMDLLSVHPEIARAVHFCIPSEYDTSAQKIPSRIIKVEKNGTVKHLR
jgi:L-threonylcarbamoyladenylate synthase